MSVGYQAHYRRQGLLWLTYACPSQECCNEESGAEVWLVVNKIVEEQVGVEEGENRIVVVEVEGNRFDCYLIRNGQSCPGRYVDLVK